MNYEWKDFNTNISILISRKLDRKERIVTEENWKLSDQRLMQKNII